MPGSHNGFKSVRAAAHAKKDRHHKRPKAELAFLPDDAERPGYVGSQADEIRTMKIIETLIKLFFRNVIARNPGGVTKQSQLFG